MTTRERKIFTACENAGSFKELSELESLFAALPEITTDEQAKVEAVAFAHFWAEQSWLDAVVAANDADLIVVVLSGAAELPMPVQRWMETWPARQPSEQKTLAVVFTAERSTGPNQAALIAYFQHVAEFHGLEFICNQSVAREPAGLRRIDPLRFMRELVLPRCARLWSSTQSLHSASSALVACAPSVPELNQ